MELLSLLEQELGEHAAEVARHFVEEELSDGRLLLEDGGVAPGARAPVFLVLEGTMAVETRRPDGGFAVSKRVGPGALLGVLSSLDQAPRSADCRAVGRVRYARLPAAAFDRLYRDRTALGLAFLDWLGRQMVRDLRTLDRVLTEAVRSAG